MLLFFISSCVEVIWINPFVWVYARIYLYQSQGFFYLNLLQGVDDNRFVPFTFS